MSRCDSRAVYADCCTEHSYHDINISDVSLPVWGLGLRRREEHGSSTCRAHRLESEKVDDG
jgi:hypothetical protein